ncbi:MAG: PEP-CTERM sorting domain-containing protein [Gammaproteobacteria bacterium]
MKTLHNLTAAAAVTAALCATAPAQAAISIDGLPGLGNNTLAGFDAGAPDLGGSNNSIGGVGELFVSIVARDQADPGSNRSYVRDLGISSRTFVEALNAGTLGSLSFNIAPDANLTSFLSTHAGKNISFNLTAVNNVSGFDPNTFESIDLGYLSTSGESAASVEAKKPGLLGEYSSAEAAFVQFVRGVNIKTDGSPSGTVALNLSGVFAPGEFGYHDNNFGGSSTFGFNTEGVIGNAVDFYFLETNNFTGAPAPAALGQWTLAANGTLSFAATAAPIPVPGAVWLLGSALVGLAGRRRAAA